MIKAITINIWIKKILNNNLRKLKSNQKNHKKLQKIRNKR